MFISQDYNNEDDCFADIINDDIIKLDESASQSLTFHGVSIGSKCIQKLPQETISSQRQGTAVRSIKLRHRKGLTQHGKPPISGCVISVLSGNADIVSGWFHPTHLILLLLLILVFVAWQGNSLNSKQHLDISIEVIKRQLKYWLHKAAN